MANPRLQADRLHSPVILATDAYTDRLVDPLRRTLIPVPSLQVATEPIPDNLRQTILPEGQSASDTWHLLRYFRLDATRAAGDGLARDVCGCTGGGGGPASLQGSARAVSAARRDSV